MSSDESYKLLKEGNNLPSHDAVAQILPSYLHLFREANTELHRAAQQEQERLAERTKAAQANKPNINHTHLVYHPHKRPLLHNSEDYPHMAEITDLQTKEVENYRSAMSKMADDIIALRTQVVTLEAENSQLCINLSLHQDLSQGLLDDTDIDVMTKAEIADCIASLKFKLASETSKAVMQQDRIQQLQNDLIKVNDSEKKLLKVQRLQQNQHENLQSQQSLLAKMATLEATVKQQEKIIEKIEEALQDSREKTKRTTDKRLAMKKQRSKTDHREEETDSTLAAENTRLRQELDRIRQQPAQSNKALPLKERLSLLNKLERAEAKAQTLQAQLEENATLWGQQKQEMLTKLCKHRPVFDCTSTTTHRDVPLLT